MLAFLPRRTCSVNGKYRSGHQHKSPQPPPPREAGRDFWHGLSSMKALRDGETEGRNRRVKAHAVITDHLIAALHAADGGLDGGGAGVPERLARREMGLLADHALATHLLHPAVGV